MLQVVNTGQQFEYGSDSCGPFNPVTGKDPLSCRKVIIVWDSANGEHLFGESELAKEFEALMRKIETEDDDPLCIEDTEGLLKTFSTTKGVDILVFRYEEPVSCGADSLVAYDLTPE